MDDDLVGAVGAVTVATRGADGLGEVLLKLRGASQTFLARSDEPLARGITVLVVESLGARTVVVVPLNQPLQ